MKKLLLFSNLFLLSIVGWGQTVANYTFTATTSTYIANAAPVTTIHGASVDDAISPNINIGFDFWYNGLMYNQLRVSSNGYVTLGTVGTSSATNQLNTATAGLKQNLAPLWDDLECFNAASGSTYCNYKLTGSAPNRILTIEWDKHRWNYLSADNVISFQCKLYETTNIIEFNYLQGPTAVNSGTASIGINSQTSNQYLSLNNSGASPTASSSISTTNISTKPANNQLYRFSPGLPAAPTGISCTPFSTTQIDLAWTDNATDELGYEVYYSTSSTVPIDATSSTRVALAANSTTTSITGLTPGTTYYFKVFARKEGLTTPLTTNCNTMSPAVPPSCATTPSPADVATGICPNNAATGTGPTISWATVSGATSYDIYFGTSATPPLLLNHTGISYTLPTPLLTSTTYYWKIVPKNAVGDATGCATWSFTTSALCYCTPTYTLGGTTDIITNVTLGALNNTTGAIGAPYYFFYSAVTIPNLERNTTNPMSITFGTDATQWSAVWIDFNQDGDFGDAGENVWLASSATGSSGTASFSISIPVGATLGNTRMRVRGGEDAALNATHHCGASSSGYGEAEDYIVNITPAPSCFVPTAVAATPTSISTASISWTAPVSGSPSSYEWEVRTSGSPGSGGASASGTITHPTVTATVTGLSPSTTYSLYVRTNCGAGGYSTWTTAVNFTTLSCQNISAQIPAPTPAPWVDVLAGTNISATFSGGSSNGGAVTDAYEYSTNAGSSWSSYTPGSTISTTSLPTGTDQVQIRTSRTETGTCPSTSGLSAVTSTTMLGSASAVAGGFQLTAPIASDFGGVYYNNTVPYNSGEFKATFSARIFDGTGADGFSFNYASDLPTSLSSGVSYEQGVGTGLSVCFVTFTGGTPAGPYIRVKYNGAILTTTATGIPTLRAASGFNYSINVDASNTLTVYQGTTLILTQVLPAGYGSANKSSWKFGFLSRTGGSHDRHTVTNINILVNNTLKWGISNCPQPTALTGSATSVTTANLSWTAPSSGSPVSYEWEVRTSGTGGSGPSGLSTSGTTTHPTVSTIVSGLLGSTTYTAYVRSFCGGTDYSSWIASSSWTQPIAGDNCLSAIDLSSLTSPISSTTTGSTHDFTNTTAFGNTSPDLIYYIDVPDCYTLAIGQTVNGYDSENRVAYGGACPGTTEISCWDDPDIQNITWLNNTGSTQRVYWIQDGYFDATNFGTFTLAWSLNPPICVAPTSPIGSCTSATDANLSWTAPSGTCSLVATGYEWEVRSSGAAGSGATGLAASGSLPLGTTSTTTGGLVGGTVYTLYVRTNCGGTYSTWASSATFQYVLGDNCASAIDLGALVSPISSTTTGSTHDFTNTTAGGNTSPDLIYYIDVPDCYTLVIGQTVNGYDSENRVAYGGACPGTTEISCWDDPDIQNITWLNNTGSTQRVYWVQDGFSSATDNGTFTLAWSLNPPGCMPPTALSATPSTSTEAALSWTAPACGTTPAGYEYFVSTSATPPASGTATVSTSATATSLTAGTTYYLHVRTDCGAGTFSTWATTSWVQLLTVITTGRTSACSPFANRTTGGTPPTTTTTGNFYYDKYSFTVPSTGTYDIEALYTDALGDGAVTSDGYLHLYQTSYDPTAPLTNIVAADDDHPGAPGSTGSLISGITLNAGTTYIIVGTSFTASRYLNMTFKIMGTALASAPATTDIGGLPTVVLTPAGAVTSLSTLCEVDNWTYYGPSHNNYCFGINWAPDGSLHATNSTAKAAAAVSITTNTGAAPYVSTDVPALPAMPIGTWLMGRYWNVTSSALAEPVDVRFFYSPSELTATESAANAFCTTHGVMYEGIRWFKSVGHAYTHTLMTPTGVDYNYDDVLNLNPLTTGGSVLGANFAQFTGVTSFSGGGLGAGAGTGTPLPVELVSIDAVPVQDAIELKWITALEINNKGFEVLRSVDAVNFEKIGWVDGNGNSTINRSYTFIDNSVSNGIVYYYKLKQIDFDNKFEYTPIVTANLNGSNTVQIGELYPNPTLTQTNIQINGSVASQAEVKIVNVLGAVVYEKTVSLNAGSNNIQIPTQGIPSGNYMVIIKADDFKVNKKLIID